MKKYVEVFWAPWRTHASLDTCWVDTLYLPPTPLMGLVHKKVDDVNGAMFNCPAIKNAVKNDFVIKAPFDLTLSFNDGNVISTDKYGQDFYNAHIINRSTQNGVLLATTPPKYVFFSKENVEMSVIDLPIISSQSCKNIKVIPGIYNISKWIRPIELTFTVLDTAQPVSFIAEEPVFAVRFHTPNSVPVKMTRFELTEDVVHNISAMVAVKRYRAGLTLDKLYVLADGLIQLVKKKF